MLLTYIQVSARGCAKRLEIFTLAVDQLKNGGYDELNSAAIASALGISRANIHHHFATKENLARVAFSQFTEDELGHLKAMLEK